MTTATDLPQRPARWGGASIDGLSTVQLGYGGLLDFEPHGDTPVHLVRSCVASHGGTPGPLLCGIDHHTMPVGFSVGGGTCTPHLGDDDPATVPCPICMQVAARMSLTATLPIEGSVGGDRARRAVLAELERMGVSRG